MAKPTNLKDTNCESKSSNCVVWGNDSVDFGCYTICKGDSISQIVYDLATMICELKTQTDITNWDLTAMEAEFGPVADFKGVIQNILTKLYPPA